MSDIVFKIRGTKKTLTVYQDRLILSTEGGMFSNEREQIFNYHSISSLDFTPSSLVGGYLHFIVNGNEGSMLYRNHMGGVLDNAFYFQSKIKGEVKAAKDYIESRINEMKSTVETTIASGSPADEIRKFKQLLDDGIINQQEFDDKKTQLLSSKIIRPINLERKNEIAIPELKTERNSDKIDDKKIQADLAYETEKERLTSNVNMVAKNKRKSRVLLLISSTVILLFAGFYGIQLYNQNQFESYFKNRKNRILNAETEKALMDTFDGDNNIHGAFHEKIIPLIFSDPVDEFNTVYEYASELHKLTNNQFRKITNINNGKSIDLAKLTMLKNGWTMQGAFCVTSIKEEQLFDINNCERVNGESDWFINFHDQQKANWVTIYVRGNSVRNLYINPPGD